MSQQELNLGILAHVDAGKTTLTERLLYEAGVIPRLGSVDDGTTQTDSLALERRRGITIRSAVASFSLENVHVNLIDTPGHPDFIAEVERVLTVLDGAVLVISAVEGVQPQTLILMRALERLRIPTLIFVNKIDRPGADDVRVVQAITERLTDAAVPMGTVHTTGTRAASFTRCEAGAPELRTQLIEVLAENDDAVLAAYVGDEPRFGDQRLRDTLADQSRRALVYPVFFGSAITGAGVAPLVTGIEELLPAAAGDPQGPVSATVFKIERNAGGERIAYVRMFSGTIRTRDRLHFGADREGKVTALTVFEHGPAVQRPSVSAGAVAQVSGLAHIQVGDLIGAHRGGAAVHHFPPPTLESVVVARNPGDRPRLRIVLGQLAEQDPLINVRLDDRRHEISVSLYGEVQKEVIESTLADDFGIEAAFRETTPIYVERPTATGEAVELLHAESNPFNATIGLRVAAAEHGTGIAFRLEIDHTGVPLYVYKRLENFEEAMGEYVREALREGLFGWQVRDCVVTLTRSNYSVPDGPPSRRGPLSTAADFRKLTPLVLMQALERARVVVCEPVARVGIELPTAMVGGVMAALSRLGASIEAPSLERRLSTVVALLPAMRARDLQQQLPGLTGGEGVLDSSFGGYQPVNGPPPTRPRTTPNPLNLGEYMMYLERRAALQKDR